MESRSRNTKWVATVASIWIQCSSGSSYAFGIYSPILKSSQNYDQSTLDSIATFKDIGANAGLLSGLLYASATTSSSSSSRRSWISKVGGPWLVHAVGAIQCFVGYLFMWLAVTGVIHRPPVPVMCFFMFLAAHAQTFFNTANVVTAVRNFPQYSGTIVGIMKRCGLRKLIFLVEGDPNASEAAESIKTACFTTEILEGMDVQRTSGLGDTLRKYGHLTLAIAHCYKEYISNEKFQTTRRCPTFDDFTKKCQDLEKMTVCDVFAIQLMQSSVIPMGATSLFLKQGICGGFSSTHGLLLVVSAVWLPGMKQFAAVKPVNLFFTALWTVKIAGCGAWRDEFLADSVKIPQVTEEIALAVLDLYPTLISLAQAYSLLEGDACAQEEMLKKQSNNLISGVASKNIFQLVWGG